MKNKLLILAKNYSQYDVYKDFLYEKFGSKYKIEYISSLHHIEGSSASHYFCVGNFWLRKDCFDIIDAAKYRNIKFLGFQEEFSIKTTVEKIKEIEKRAMKILEKM